MSQTREETREPVILADRGFRVIDCGGFQQIGDVAARIVERARRAKWERWLEDVRHHAEGRQSEQWPPTRPRAGRPQSTQ